MQGVFVIHVFGLRCFSYARLRKIINIKGVGNGKIDIFFKELRPHSRTYELRGQGEKKNYKI